MENVKSSSIRNPINGGKHSLLPPKCPFPNMPPSFANYVPGPVLGARGFPQSRRGNPHHLRTSSESFLVEEQPLWLDDLLDEPETPLRKGTHRRASSDSTYLDVTNVPRDALKYSDMVSVPSWGSLNPGSQNDAKYASFYNGPRSFPKPNNPARNQGLLPMAHQSCSSFGMANVAMQNPPKETDVFLSNVTEKQDQVEMDSHLKTASEGNDFYNAKPCPSETDTKRAKQQFAQRSRVRKLQYIAELERTVQVLQEEGCEVTGHLEFINQQNLILSMENKALKQRLDSLSQEHLIKHLEHEVLEREIARLQVLLQQQKLPPPSSLRRTGSKDLDSHFANLSLKFKDTTPGCNPMAGPLHF